MQEQWKDIKGWEGFYLISNKGKVFSIRKKRCLKACFLGRYFGVGLCRHGKSKQYKIARLVALNFIPNPENKPEVNHKDGNKTNDNVKNLEWNTGSENRKHAFRAGLDNQQGEKNNRSKLTKSEVLQIRKLFPNDMGYLYRDIAKIYNITCKHISKIMTRKIWVHI